MEETDTDIEVHTENHITKKPLSLLTVLRTVIGILSIINCIVFLIVFVPACTGAVEEKNTTGAPNWSNDVTCYENGWCCDSTDWCCDENGWNCVQTGCWGIDDVPTDESLSIVTENENNNTSDEEESSFPQNIQAEIEDFVSRYIVTCFLPFAAILFFTLAGIFSLLFCRNRKKYSYIVIAVLYGLALICSLNHQFSDGSAITLNSWQDTGLIINIIIEALFVFVSIWPLLRPVLKHGIIVFEESNEAIQVILTAVVVLLFVIVGFAVFLYIQRMAG